MCFPGWADQAVFASMIGSEGHYVVQPAARFVWGGYYEDGSLIWVSRWATTEGFFESREALAFPGDPNRAVLLRRLRAVDQAGEFLVSLDLRTDYGRKPLAPWNNVGQCWESRGRDITARWWGAPPGVRKARHPEGALQLKAAVGAGESLDLVLEVMATEACGEGSPDDPPDSDALWRSTVDAWKKAVPPCEGMAAQRDVRRSYAVLRGLTGPEGGTVAAATTSLPERAGANRNYDYRYVWVRDTCYIGRAGSTVPGGERMLDDAVRWVAGRLLADGDKLAPAYLPNGSPVPGVEMLDLPGYPGGRDVIGNQIRDQFQLDAIGEALLLFSIAAERGRLDPTGWEAAKTAADAIANRWHEPESGIWEIEPELWTASRLICVAGLRNICARAEPQWATSYLALADEILAEVAANGVHPTGRWQRSPTDDRVDASLLLSEIRGALPGSDPRSVATRRAVATELSQDDYIYRYAQRGSPLGDAEGAFLICNFWLSLAALSNGDIVHGVSLFERARSSAGTPGLLAEELDVVEHQLRGNLPQAFVHALLIEAAAAQSEIR